jgi:hypothetical protein
MIRIDGIDVPTEARELIDPRTTASVGSDSRDLHEASMLVMAAYRADIFSSREIEEALNARLCRRPGTSSDAAGAF